MKKLLMISLLVAGTFASVGTVSASDYGSGYPDWAQIAMDTARINN